MEYVKIVKQDTSSINTFASLIQLDALNITEKLVPNVKEATLSSTNNVTDLKL
jgi:hypothetical protein